MKNFLNLCNSICLGYYPVAKASIVVPCLILALAIASIAPAYALGPRPHCKVCRRFSDTSPSKIDVSYKFGRRVVSYKVCSMFCYLEFIEDFTEHEPLSTRIVNFDSLDKEFQLSISLERAYFLHGVEGDEELVHEPYSIAFAIESQAQTAQEELGGDLMRYEELAEIVKELTDEWEPENPGPRHKPNRRIPR